MKTKREILTAVRDNIEAHGVVEYSYCNGECYCAIGYVLKELGMDDAQLTALEMAGINYIIDTPKSTNVLSSLASEVKRLTDTAGFTSSELNDLQLVNDRCGDRRRDSILDHIDRMIQDIAPSPTL